MLLVEKQEKAIKTLIHVVFFVVSRYSGPLDVLVRSFFRKYNSETFPKLFFLIDNELSLTYCIFFQVQFGRG